VVDAGLVRQAISQVSAKFFQYSPLEVSWLCLKRPTSEGVLSQDYKEE